MVLVCLILILVVFSVRVYERGEAVNIARLISGSESEDIYCFPTFRPDVWWAVVQEPDDFGFRYFILKIDSLRQHVIEKRTAEAPIKY